MKYVRWYDKNPDLKQIFEVIQNMDESCQRMIAQDIIQILMNVLRLDLDEEINKISSNYNYKCKRWYDDDINLFTSFEIIKNLPDDLQHEVAKKIVETVLLVYIGELTNG